MVGFFKSVLFANLAAIFYILMYRSLYTLNISHISLVDTSFFVSNILNVFIVYFSIRLFRVIDGLIRYTFLCFLISAVIKFILNTFIVIYGFTSTSSHLVDFGNFLYVTYVIFDVTAWFLIVAYIAKKWRNSNLLISLMPITCFALFLILFVTFSSQWYLDVNLLTVDDFIHIYLDFVLFLLNIICLSQAQNWNLILLALASLSLMTSYLGVSYKNWEDVFYEPSLPAYFWILGRILFLIALTKLWRDKDYNIKNWFNSVDSIKTQIILWANNIPALLFLLIVTYFSFQNTEYFFSKIFFQKALTAYIPFTAVCYVFALLASRFFMKPLTDLENLVGRFSDSKGEVITFIKPSVAAISEFRNLEEHIGNNLLKIQEKTEREKELFKIASKAAHDIRSPLSVLDILSCEIENYLNEKQKKLFTNSLLRIKNISYELLEQYKNIIRGAIISESKLVEIPILIPVLDMIEEKKFQYKSREINIKFFVKDISASAFISAQEFYLRRIISNLINNAVEAIPDAGKILCFLTRMKTKPAIRLTVVDNGKGMSQWLVDAIRSRTVETTKAEGMGIGLKSTWEKVESWGGTCKIKSKLGKGTAITLQFPLIKAPAWFGFQIPVRENMVFIVLDDEEFYHDQWNSRFNCKRTKEKNTLLIHCYNENYFIEQLETYSDTEIFCLIDHQIEGEEKTGLEIIVSHHLEKNAYLVTNHYSDLELQRLAIEKGVKILPKPMILYAELDVS